MQVGRMDDDRFLSLVQREARLDRDGAQRAARAVLSTLAERLSRGEHVSLARLLPEPLSQWVQPRNGRERFDAAEFLRRTAERAGTDDEEAARLARAVLLALSRALTAQEFHDLVAELPAEFQPLLEEAHHRPGEPLGLDEWLHRVSDRGGVDLETARRASDAALQALGERLSAGEVDDVAKEIPPELREALERGTLLSHGVARAMPLGDFVRRVAEAVGVSAEEARVLARAVLSTLRDSVTQKAFHDVTSQLPREYLAELMHA